MKLVIGLIAAAAISASAATKDWEMIIDIPSIRVDVNIPSFRYEKDNSNKPGYSAIFRIAKPQAAPMQALLFVTEADCRRKTGNLVMIDPKSSQVLGSNPFNISSTATNMIDLYSQSVCDIGAAVFNK